MHPTQKYQLDCSFDECSGTPSVQLNELSPVTNGTVNKVGTWDRNSHGLGILIGPPTLSL